jgi:hypothetical protein
MPCRLQGPRQGDRRCVRQALSDQSPDDQQQRPLAADAHDALGRAGLGRGRADARRAWRHAGQRDRLGQDRTAGIGSQVRQALPLRPGRLGRHARAAGRVPGRRCRGLVTRRLVGDLHKNLVLLDHAEFETGALLDRIVPLLEITHFGIEARRYASRAAGWFPSVAATADRHPRPATSRPCPATADAAAGQSPPAGRQPASASERSGGRKSGDQERL